MIKYSKCAKLLASSWVFWGATYGYPTSSEATLIHTSSPTSGCTGHWLTVLAGAGNLSGLRIIHLSYLGLLCILSSKKKCNGSLLSAHYVACVLLGPGDWRGTVFAFLINLCLLKRSCFPLEAKGRNLGHRLGSSVVNYWPSESLSAGDACGGAQQGDERVGSMVRQTRLWSQPLPIKNGGAPGRLLSLWASLFLSTKCW